MSFDQINADGCRTLEAAADLSAKQYYIVKLASATTINVSDSAAAAYGVLQDKPKSGEHGLVAVAGSGGITRVISDGSGTAIAAGDFIKSHTNGKAIKAGTDKDRAIGMALEASSADGTIIAVDLGAARDLAV